MTFQVKLLRLYYVCICVFIIRLDFKQKFNVRKSAFLDKRLTLFDL